MLTILGWLWQSKTCIAKYEPYNANIWVRMIHRHLSMPHRFILMTDQPDAKYDPLITPVPLWDDWRNVVNKKWGDKKPNCYVRLKAFSEQAGEILGPRFVSIDLDCLVLANLDPLFQRQEDFLIFHRAVKTERDKVNPYQGSMWMMTVGARAQVWNDFKGEESIIAAGAYMGTDQAWIRYKLGPNEAGWGEKDGVYSWPVLAANPKFRGKPPENARLIFFHGGEKPWSFPNGEGPKCGHCGSPVKVQPPYVLITQRRNTHPWIAKSYR